MVEQFPGLDKIAEGATRALIKEAIDRLSQRFYKPAPSGPIIVNDLDLAEPQKFYQQNILHFQAGEFIPRSFGGKNLLEMTCSLVREKGRIGIWGIGGYGKTRLAAEAVAKLLPEFPGGVLWLSAVGTKQFTLNDALIELSHLMRIPFKGNMENTAKQKLEKMGKVLIVFDNLDNVKDPELFSFMNNLPRNCFLLFTTKVWLEEYKGYHRIEMPKLDSKESQALIIQRCFGRKLSPEQEAKIIEACMGNAWFIKALVEAAIEQRELRPIIESLKKGDDLSDDRRVFGATYDQLTAKARNILAALSLFQSKVSLSHLSEVTNIRDLNDALVELLQPGFIQSENIKDKQMWRVVPGIPSTFAQTLPQRTLFEPAFAQLFLKLARQIRVGIEEQDEDTDNYQGLEQSRNFISALSWYANMVNSQPHDWNYFNDFLKMLRLVDSLLAAQGYWQEIVQFQEQALKAAKKWENSERMGEFTHRLGRIYLSRRRYKEAKQYFEESIMWNFKYPLGIARSKHELGIVAQHAGQYEQAELLFNESLNMKQELLKSCPPSRPNYKTLEYEVAYSLHGLAVFKLDNDDFKVAETLARESLDVKRKPFVAKNINIIATTQLLLGQILRYEGRYAESEKEFQGILKLASENHKLYNNIIARAKRELGWLFLHVNNRPDKALQLYEEAYDITDEIKIELDKARVLEYIGELFYLQGRFTEAEEAYRTSLGILRDSEEIRDLPMVLKSYAGYLDKVGRLKEAIETLQEAIALFQKMGRPTAESEATLRHLLDKESDK